MQRMARVKSVKDTSKKARIRENTPLVGLGAGAED